MAAHCFSYIVRPQNCRKTVYMKSNLFKLVVITAQLFLIGCAQIDSKQTTTLLKQVTDVATGPLQTRPSVTEFNGDVAILYSTKAGRVAFQLGEQRHVLDETARVRQGASFFQLKVGGNDLHALWWSHQDGKNAYITSSNNGGIQFGPVTVVNDDHGILSPLTLIKGANGLLGISYLDERHPGYQVYFNRSVDNGQTWASPDQRLDTNSSDGRSTTVYEPQTVVSGEAWITVWADVIRGQGQTVYRILSRRSVDGGQSWAPTELMYSTSHQPTSLIVRTLEANIVVAADEVSHGVFVLTSQDQGRTWMKSGFLDGTAGHINSGLDLALSSGKAHLVWMQDRTKEKTHVMRASLNIAQSKWLGSAQRMDIKTHENTRSISPVVSSTLDGTLVAAWVDYRDIRPNIYLSVSYDQGLVWTSPQALLAAGEVSAGWPQLIPWGTQAAVAYELYPTDKLSEGNFEVRRLDVNKSTAGILGLPETNAISEENKKARLEQRVQALWNYRVDGDYGPAYDIFDFAYKATTPKKFYMDNVGVINYLAYSVDSISINGNEAEVNMKLKYEVKPMILPMTGKPISVQPVDVESPSKWVWIGSDWYLVYAPTFDPPVLQY